MSYRLVYTRRAVRDIQGLDPDTEDRLGRVLLRYAEDPLKGAERLTERNSDRTVFVSMTIGSYSTSKGRYRGAPGWTPARDLPEAVIRPVPSDEIRTSQGIRNPKFEMRAHCAIPIPHSGHTFVLSYLRTLVRFWA